MPRNGAGHRPSHFPGPRDASFLRAEGHRCPAPYLTAVRCRELTSAPSCGPWNEVPVASSRHLVRGPGVRGLRCSGAGAEPECPWPGTRRVLPSAEAPGVLPLSACPALRVLRLRPHPRGRPPSQLLMPTVFLDCLMFWRLGALQTWETRPLTQGHLLPKKKTNRLELPLVHKHHVPGQRPPARLPVPGEQRPHPAPRAHRHASGWAVLACRLSSRPPHGHAAASCLLPPKRIPRGLAAPCWLRHLHPRGADETPPHHPVLLRPVGGSTLSKMPSPSPQGQPSRSRQLKVTEMPQWAHVAFQSHGPCSQAKDGSQPHF